jgi:hypothetical protein
MYQRTPRPRGLMPRAYLMLLLCVTGCFPSQIPTPPPEPNRPTSPAPLEIRSVEGTWMWRCCHDQWRGALVLTQQGTSVKGILLDDLSGGGTQIEGTVEGELFTFRRQWLNDGRVFSQSYSLRLEAGGDKLTGTFIEHHAPGPAIEFTAERGWSSEPKPYNGVAGTLHLKDVTPIPDTGNGASNPLLCECANYQCGCSGVPQLMRCHNECGCPACPANIP